MKCLFITTLIAGGLASSLAAAPTFHAAHGLPTLMVEGQQGIWLAKNDKAKGPKKAKQQKQKPKKQKAQGQKVRQDNPGKAKEAKEAKAAKASPQDRTRAEEVLNVAAPRNRDMTAVLGAAALAYLGADRVFADVPEDEVITYRNCPPGLAKKDPPCVPPGLAKQGVTYEQWVSYDEGEIDQLWERERDEYLGRDELPALEPDAAEALLLSSDQVAGLYGLDPAPEGQRYALIDGLPVVLDERDYLSLLQINELAGLTDVPQGVQIAPTAALTQLELQQQYGLPALAQGDNYAVLNGQVVTLADSAYDTLQLIRVARSVF